MKEKKAIRQLKVALTPGTEKLEKVKASLIEKGHEVTVLPELADYDLVMGANCMRMVAKLESLLAVVIKGVRMRKYGAKGNKVREDYNTEGM